MRRSSPGRLATAAAFLGMFAPAIAAPAGNVTRAELMAIFQRDPVVQVKLSPDGRHLAYIARDRGRELLSIVDVDNPEKRVLLPSTQTRFIGWTNSNLLVYAPPRELRAVNADGKNDRKLVDELDLGTWVNAGAQKEPERRIPQVVGIVPTLPGSVVVGATGRFVSDLTPNDFYLVDVATGQREHLAGRETEGQGFADLQGRIRVFRTASQQFVSVAVPSLDLSGPLPVRTWVTIRAWNNVPQKYLVRGPEGGRWVDFDEEIGNGAGIRFSSGSKEFFGERAFPLGFGLDPNLLYYASNVGRDTYGIYSLDLAKKQSTAFALEDPVYDLAGPDDGFTQKALVFDRSGELAGINRPDGKPMWNFPELTRAQRALEREFEPRSIRLLDWDTARERFLFLAYSAADPGRYFVYDAKRGTTAEFLRRSGELSLAKMGSPRRFEFDSPYGGRLTGTLTQPRTAVINPPPLVIFCRDFPGEPASDGFSADAQALAALGFVVAEVNHRGLLGFGQRHLNAVLGGLDRVPLEDVRATIEWIAQQQKIDRTRIAIVGEGMGGLVAVRALELYPEEFRCAVTINAPPNLTDFVLESQADGRRRDERAERIKGFLRKLPSTGDYSMTADAKKITKPVLIMEESAIRGVEPVGRSLQSAIRGNKGDVSYFVLSGGFRLRDPGARAAAYLEIGDFMRAALYNFDVKVGPVRVK